MNFEYIIIGIVFLLVGITYIIYKFRYHTIKEDEETGFKHQGLGGAIIIIMLAIYLIWNEVEKII